MDSLFFIYLQCFLLMLNIYFPFVADAEDHGLTSLTYPELSLKVHEVGNKEKVYYNYSTSITAPLHFFSESTRIHIKCSAKSPVRFKVGCKKLNSILILNYEHLRLDKLMGIYWKEASLQMLEPESFVNVQCIVVYKSRSGKVTDPSEVEKSGLELSTSDMYFYGARSNSQNCTYNGNIGTLAVEFSVLLAMLIIVLFFFCAIYPTQIPEENAFEGSQPRKASENNELDGEGVALNELQDMVFDI